jgi:diguanylate cyclase (GGDEF)-like protein
MFMSNHPWLQRWDTWICPASREEEELLPKEIQRRHISRFLAPIILCGLCVELVSFPAKPLTAAISMAVTLFGASLSIGLCHFRHARMAAWICLAFMFASAPIRMAIVPSLQDALNISFSLLLPVCFAGILLGSLTAIIICGCTILFTLSYGFVETGSLMESYIFFQPFFHVLFYMTIVIAIGMFGMNRALQESDRTQLLEEMNQELYKVLQAHDEMEAEMAASLAETERVNIELQTVFDTVPDALVVYDANLKLRHVNAAGRVLYDIDPAEGDLTMTAPGIQVCTLNGDPIPIEDLPLCRIMHGDSREHVLVEQLRFSDGVTMVAHTRTSALVDTNGKMLGVVSMAHDITNEYSNQRNLNMLRTIAKSCAEAMEPETVASKALQAICNELDIIGAMLIGHDPDRPGFAKILGYEARDDGLYDMKIIPGFMARLASMPVKSGSSLDILAVMSEGTLRHSTMHVHRQAQNDTRLEEINVEYPSVSIPLWLGTEIFGALAIMFPAAHMRPADQPTDETLFAIADEVAVALHRANLYQEAQRLALYDPLTSLLNHRGLQQSLQQELSANAAQGLPVSILMIDVDHFRTFNDTYGHETGDRALREVAKAIQSINAGWAARYGGEEFILVLPETNDEQAAVFSEQLQAAIHEIAIIDDTMPGAPITLTTSIGHATFPIHASATASLLKAADLALYTAKRAGRDSTVAYSPSLLNAGIQRTSTTTTANAAGAVLALPSGADLDMVQSLITAIDLRDGYTAAHSDGVARWAVAIGQELNLPAEQIEALHLGGLVHDVGKIGISDNVLRKPGKLNAEEWEQMMAHPAMGEAILRPVEQLRHLLPLVRWHHERLDGSGYPDGLKGDEIPYLVRILSVADVFDAFTAERPYHPARSEDEGLQLLFREAKAGKMERDLVEIMQMLLSQQSLIDTSSVHDEHELQEAA